MGKDGDSDDLESGLNPELEAQIVALIHGELSGEALAAVEAELAKDPAAEVYRERMEFVHQMLGEVSGREEDKEWTLAPERRAHLLETFSTAGASESGQEIVDLESLREKRARRAGRRMMWSVAACFVFSLFLVTLVTEPWIVLERHSGAVTEPIKQAPDASKLLLQSEPMAEAASFADGFAASPAGAELAFPETREAPEAAVRQRAFQKPEVSKSKVARESPKVSRGEKIQKAENALEALEAADEGPVSPPVAARRAPVRPEGLSEKELSPSADSVNPPPGAQAAAISEAVESSDEAGLEPQTDEAESFTEPAEEEAGGGEKRREVAFLGLGVFLGLLLGALFGLGLGRTWQRRAHSSH